MRPATTAGERDVWEATEEDQEASLHSNGVEDEHKAEEEAVGGVIGRARTFDGPNSRAIHRQTFDGPSSSAIR